MHLNVPVQTHITSSVAYFISTHTPYQHLPPCLHLACNLYHKEVVTDVFLTFMVGSVIVCRSSPRQKAAVVRVVKELRRAQRHTGTSWVRRTVAWLNSSRDLHSSTFQICRRHLCY